MNWLDILIIVLLIVSIISGLKAGIIKILLTIVGLIVGVVLAGRFSGTLADRLTFISDPNTANIVAFIFIMIAVMIIAGILAFLLKNLASAILLGWVNRIGGAVLGLFMGMIFIGAILAMLAKYAGIGATLGNSVFAGFLLDKFPIVLGFLPKEFDLIKSYFQ